MLCINSINYAGDEKLKFTMGYSIFSFQEVNPTDASAAISVYVKIFKERVEKALNKEVLFTSQIYHSLKEMKEAVDNNEVGLLSLSVTEYYKLKKSCKITPYLAATNKDDAFEQYCILHRNSSSIANVQELKGRILSVPGYENHPMLEDWLINLLAKNKLGPMNKVFGQIKFSDKESNAIYNVFFKNADVAVVRKSVFDAVCELNPQIKKSLSAFIFSPPMILAFTAGNNKADSRMINTIVNYAMDLPSTQSGQNILNIFKANRFVRIKEEDLKTAFDILTENEYFKQQPTSKTKKPVR